MNILHIIYDDSSNPWCGGGGALRAVSVNERLARNNRVVVLTGNFPGARNERIEGVDYVRVGFGFSYLVSRISFTLLIAWYMRRFDSDIVVNDCSFFAPCFADLYTRRPVVNIIHHIMGSHAVRIYLLFGIFPFLAEKLLLKTAKCIVTPSKRVKMDIQTRHQGKVISNIPNGISEDLLQLDPEEGDFILFLGRIDIYMKGIDILMASFSRIRNRNTRLKIAGSGKRGDVRRLRGLIKAHQLEERVAYLGRVDGQEKLELLRTCLFVVMPSRFEGWGMVALEANAAAKAVAGAAIEGLTEAVADGKTALLVAPENVEKLAEAIDRLIEERELRASLGNQGRAWARRFSWRTVSEAQVGFYASVLERFGR